MSKYLLILRGVSGAGKSTYAKKLQKRFWSFYESKTSHRFRHAASWVDYPAIASADNYFLRPDGKYDFNGKFLADAHAWCFSEAKRFMFSGVRVIILDNTNTRKWEYEKYIELAKQSGYIVKERIIGNTDEDSLKLYANRNQHGVPEESIKKMASRFEK